MRAPAIRTAPAMAIATLERGPRRDRPVRSTDSVVVVGMRECRMAQLGAVACEAGTARGTTTRGSRQMSALGEEVSPLVPSRVCGQQVLVQTECCAGCGQLLD